MSAHPIPASPVSAREDFPLLGTVLANGLVALVLPIIGVVGLIYCYLAHAARREGDLALAARRLQSASAIARVTLYGGLVLVAVGAVGMMVFLMGAGR